MARRAMISVRSTHVLAGILLGALPASEACAADEEIQVYMDEMNRGGYGLDVHLNYVPEGLSG